MGGTFNFTQDILNKASEAESYVELERQLKERVNRDPSGLVDPDAHIRLRELTAAPVNFPNGLEEEEQLTSWEYRVVNLIEQDFWSRTQKIPTLEELVSSHPEFEDKRKELNALYNKRGFYWVLEKRGIEVPEYVGDESGPTALSPRQLLAANFMLNLHDSRSDREKLKELGISSQQWHAWLNDPVFSNYLRNRAENMYGSQDYKAYAGLLRAIDNNDFQAIKFFFEMRGIYNPKMEVQVNINHVMNRVVEIIQLHVKEPEVLNAIADDLSAIESS